MPVFQLVRLVLNERHQVVARLPLQPLFDLREDAMAMAEFSAARSSDDFDYDRDSDCWRATESNGRTIRFVVEPTGLGASLAA
jgi:hypothetical protein